MYRFAIVLACIIGFGSTAEAQTATSWGELYMRDLDSLRAAIAANHPGAADVQNPEFSRTLDRAYREARALASRIKDLASFQIGLTRFINQFQDAHLQVAFSRQVDSLREAGIIVKYRNRAFHVVDVHQRYPDSDRLVGTQVLMCDGVPARTVFRDRVLKWRGREHVEADWYRQAPQFFIDYGPPTPRAPRSCTFDAGGSRIIVQLQWRSTAAPALNAVLQRAQPLPRGPGTERISEHALWVRLPTFAANADPQLSALRATLDSLRAFTAAQPAWSLIVFDLRGNSGGSSSWGDQIARILFGEEWQRQATSYLFDGVYTEWRLTAANIQAMRGIQAQIAARDGAQSASARSFGAFVDSAEAEFGRGIKYYGTRQTRTGAAPPSAVPVPGRIVVVTSPSCFSACLDFLDRMRLHPAVVQVGQTTGVDTNYMENWGGPISALTFLSQPLKVYRNRRRANNEAYGPQVGFEGWLEDDAQLRDWILQNVRSW